jgi:prophage regulatory protein
MAANEADEAHSLIGHSRRTETNDGDSAIHQRDPSALERLNAVPLKFLRFTAVRDRTGLSRSTIWRLERRGEFPKHRRIAPNAVGWVEQEIHDWMLAKPKAS